MGYGATDMVLNSVRVFTRCTIPISSKEGSASQLTYLPNHSALEHHKHEQSENTVIPVLIQAPQGHAKDLEHKEWRGCMITKEFSERGDRDVEFVPSVQGFKGIYLFRLETGRREEVRKGGMVSAWIREAGEYNGR